MSLPCGTVDAWTMKKILPTGWENKMEPRLNEFGEKRAIVESRASLLQLVGYNHRRCRVPERFHAEPLYPCVLYLR